MRGSPTGSPAAGRPTGTDPAARSLPARLWARFGHLVAELGKFGVVGGIAYVIDVTVFNLLLSAAGPYLAAVASTTVAATGAFVGNRSWTWRHRARTGLHREYLLYFGFNLVGLLIALACLWLSHHLLGLAWPAVFHTRLADNVAKNLVGTALGTLFRFWAYRRFVFTAPVPAPDAGR